MVWKTLLILALIILPSSQSIFTNLKQSSRISSFDVPTDFLTIQAAIDHAAEGDTIFVHEGVYYENVIVNKTLTLIGENREKTIVDGNGKGMTLEIRAKNVDVENFTIRGSGNSTYGSGIFVDSSGCIITENTFAQNGLFGICLNYSSNCFISKNMVEQNNADGIVLLSSYNNTILGNTIEENTFGLHLYSSDQNNISDNVFDHNRLGGINLLYSSSNRLLNNNLTANTGLGMILDYYSDSNTVGGNVVSATVGYGLIMGTGSNNTLRNNRLKANTYNFYCPAPRSSLPDFLNDIDTSNTVDGKQIYYVVSRNGLLTAPSFTDVGYLALINCTRVTVLNITISENGQGLFLAFTSDSTIQDVKAAKNQYGLQLLSSSNNTIVNSTFVDNDEDGITLDYSSTENNIAYNEIENNSIGVRMAHDTNGNHISNNIIANNIKGLWIYAFVDENIIKSNLLENNSQGISMARECSRNTITDNTLGNNNVSMVFSYSSSNVLFRNNFVNDTVHVANENSTNVWDDGYPDGGNFWSDYAGTDVHSGPGQDQPGSDGIGDTPYTIDSENKDRYPLMDLANTTGDASPPLISFPLRTPETEIAPSQEVKVFAAVFDGESGIENVTLWYSTDEGQTWFDLTMAYNLSSGLYEATIPGQPAFAQVRYKIIALDRSGNEAERKNSDKFFAYQIIPEYSLGFVLIFSVVAMTTMILFRHHRKNHPE